MSDHYQVIRDLAVLLAEKGAKSIADLARMLRPHSPNPDISAKLDALMAEPAATNASDAGGLEAAMDDVKRIDAEMSRIAQTLRRVPRGDAA